MMNTADEMGMWNGVHICILSRIYDFRKETPYTYL